MAADIAVATILTTLIIIDIAGNLLVCFIIKVNKDMRSPINYLLVNLAISDITFATFVAPNHILKRAFTHPDGIVGSWLCRFLTGGNVAWVGAAASSVTLVAIAVERYYTVTCPLGSRGKLTKRKLKVIIPCCWIFAWTLNIPLIMVTNFDKETGDCKWMWPEQWMGVANETTWLVGLAFIPLMVMTGLYSRVVHMLWFKRSNDNELPNRQRGVLRVRKRATLSVITVSAIFGVCWITGLFVYVLSYYDISMFGPPSYAIADTMFMFNSAVNPFVYSLLNERFKEKLKGMICCKSSTVNGARASREPNRIGKPGSTPHAAHNAGAGCSSTLSVDQSGSSML